MQAEPNHWLHPFDIDRCHPEALVFQRDRAIAPGYLIAYSIDCIIATIDLTSLGNRHMLKSMWDQNSTNQPTVFRLSQKAGPVVEQVLRRSERDWPLTLDDCQAALTRLLPPLRLNRAGYGDYWRWVGRTRTEMTRLYAAQLQSCRARQDWDLAALVRLRWCLESVTVRLYCAPWLSGRAESPVLGLSQFNRLSA